MARKDIYKIDNYFIAIGYTLLFLGALSTLFDPHMWSEVVIKETVDGKTRHTFEDKPGARWRPYNRKKVSASWWRKSSVNFPRYAPS